SAGHPAATQDSLPGCWLGLAWAGLAPAGLRSRISRRWCVCPPFLSSQTFLAHREYTVGSRKWLELGITGTEGNYLIYQAWYLSDDGIMLARAYSRGEQCPNATHTHHPYWRFDFDIVQPENNQVFVYDGLSIAWTQYLQERNATKIVPSNRLSWF